LTILSNLFFILGSLIASFLLTFAIMPYGIRLLTRLKMGKQIREEGLMGKAIEFAKLHEGKKGTPTMGGLAVIVTVIMLTILSIGVNALSPWTESIFGWSISHTLWNRQETYIVMFTLLSVGAIGLVDDLLNIRGIGKTK
jgi:phospho-N-acetylmuramoyl-pentapeptide-transferase